MRTRPLTDARDTTGRAFLCAALRWMQSDPGPPDQKPPQAWTEAGSALVYRALWSDWLLRGAGLEFVAPVSKRRKPEDSRRSAKRPPPMTPQALARLTRKWRAFWMAPAAPTRRSAFRRWLAEGLTPKALRGLHRELRQFRDALVPEVEQPITVTTLPSGHTGVKVIRGKDGACRVVQTVAGWRQAVRLVLAHAVAQNRLRRCRGCSEIFVRERVTASRAGRPAQFCSTACGQRVAGKRSYEKHKPKRVAWQREYRRRE